MINVTTRSKYGGENGTELVKWYRGKIQKLEEGTEEALTNMAIKGAELMRHYIASRGTEKGGRLPRNPGRIDTSDMHDDVTHRVIKGASGKVQAHFGWLDRRKYYYGLQEGGFNHPFGGPVEGMYAMTDAANEVFQELRTEMGNVVKRA